MDARGKFGEHERCVSALRNSRESRDRGGGGAGRDAAPPLFCAPTPTFCAKK